MKVDNKTCSRCLVEKVHNEHWEHKRYQPPPYQETPTIDLYLCPDCISERRELLKARMSCPYESIEKVCDCNSVEDFSIGDQVVYTYTHTGSNVSHSDPKMRTWYLDRGGTICCGVYKVAATVCDLLEKRVVIRVVLQIDGRSVDRRVSPCKLRKV